MQGTYKSGIPLVVERQQINIRSAIFELQIGIGKSGQIHNRFLCKVTDCLLIFRNLFILRHQTKGKGFDRDGNIVKAVKGFTPGAVGGMLTIPESLIVFCFHIPVLVDFVSEPDTEYNKTCKKIESHI